MYQGRKCRICLIMPRWRARRVETAGKIAAGGSQNALATAIFSGKGRARSIISIRHECSRREYPAWESQSHAGGRRFIQTQWGKKYLAREKVRGKS